MSAPDDLVVPTLLLLADGDDVVIATGDLGPGRHLASDGSSIELVEAVRLGHKIAAHSLAIGDRVVRSGVPIGSMIAPAIAGSWVHTHNLISDYIVTYAHRGGAE